MKHLKKTLMLSIVLSLGYFTFYTNSSFANGDLPFYDVSQTTNFNEDNLNIAGNLTSEELTTDTSTFAKIRDFFGMGTYTSEQAPALAYIKMIINMILGLVSLISLIMIIMAFYLIFFSEQEESLAKAKKMLIGVAIALAVMGLSRYIISYFYEIFSTTTGAL